MRALLGRLLVLASVVISCNAQCYNIPLEKLPGNSPDECIDLDGVKHPMNSKWKTKDCYECSCGQNEINCCNTVLIPTAFDRINCKKIFHPESCTYTVVDLKNPQKACHVGGWVM